MSNTALVDGAAFEQIVVAERPRLLGIAYRMTGSWTDAEDIVQEAMVRTHRTATGIETPGAYLTTVTTRLAIDHLRSARVRRETYVGPWLPEPIAKDPAPDAAARALRRDTLSMAFLVMLETLSAHERAVVILHDVFAYEHREIAPMLERSTAACRQLLRRARVKLDNPTTRTDVDLSRRDALVARFVAACETGGLDAFFAMLVDDAELIFDGGPNVKTAARHPIHGADRVARFLAYVMNRLAEGRDITKTTMNAEPAALVHTGSGSLIGAVFLEPSSDHRATTIRWVRNPAKLTGLSWVPRQPNGRPMTAPDPVDRWYGNLGRCPDGWPALATGPAVRQ